MAFPDGELQLFEVTALKVLEYFTPLFLAATLVACSAGSGGAGEPRGTSSQVSSLQSNSSSQASSTSQANSSSVQSSSSTSAPAADAARIKQGYLLDSAVANIGYRTASLSGFTDTQGGYHYREGETLEFFIGELILPSVAAQPTITPLQLAGTHDIDHPLVINIARLLQSLDTDGNATNGIDIDPRVVDLATAINLDQSVVAFQEDAAVINLLANAGAAHTELVGVEAARAHLQATLDASVNDRVLLSANGEGNTYELINQTLGGTAVESPVCDYSTDNFGRRITDPFDDDLGAHVFAFHLLRDIDGDRCRPEITDRQRMEIKTYNQSPAKLLAAEGEIHTYRWKFKLDAGFQPSGSFTHIFQIKPQGGSDEGLPILVFTPRLASPERFEVSFNPSDNLGKSAILVASASLSELNANEGRAEVVLRRLSDGEVLIEWSNNNLDMWRAGANFNRPKWGIYRSLNTPGVLRDETVLFNDFCIAKGTNTCPFIARD
jgi:hypothetical protein